MPTLEAPVQAVPAVALVRAGGSGNADVPVDVVPLNAGLAEPEPGERDRLLDDPWAFKEFLFSRQFTSRLLVNKQNTGGLERHLLLHNSYANGGVNLLTDFAQALPRRPVVVQFEVDNDGNAA